jgi:hypothetical protein
VVLHECQAYALKAMKETMNQTRPDMDKKHDCDDNAMMCVLSLCCTVPSVGAASVLRAVAVSRMMTHHVNKSAGMRRGSLLSIADKVDSCMVQMLLCTEKKDAHGLVHNSTSALLPALLRFFRNGGPSLGAACAARSIYQHGQA